MSEERKPYHVDAFFGDAYGTVRHVVDGVEVSRTTVDPADVPAEMMRQITSPKSKKYALLRIPPQDHDIFLVVETLHDDPEVADYAYEEGTCPSDTMRSVANVIIGDDDDPHGLIWFEGLLGEHSVTADWLAVTKAIRDDIPRKDAEAKARLDQAKENSRKLRER